LWQRGEDSLKRIAYPEGRKVPSWSWMAHAGSIEYMQIDFEQVEWNIDIKVSSEGVLKILVRSFQRCISKEENLACTVVDDMSDQRGWIRFDGICTVDIRTLKCVIIGVEKWAVTNDKKRWNDGKHCYIIVVQPTCKGQVFGEYERVGVGYVDGRYISVEGVESRIV